MEPIRKLRPLFGSPRYLKNLVVREISSVDRGAGVGTKVVLMKKETAMPRIDPAQQAFAMWDEFTNLLMARGDLTKGEAINAALKSSTGQELFRLAKQARGYHSSDGDSQRLETAPVSFPQMINQDHSGRVHPGRDYSGSRIPSMPQANSDQDGADELSRLRATHAQKAAHAALAEINEEVDEAVRGGEKRDKAHAAARSKDWSRWEKALAARGHPPA
jgi:hypothetical protein